MAAADTTTTADAAAADSGEEFTVTPYMKHVPDSYTELEAAQGASWELGAGHYELGFEVDGARIPILKLKGGGVAKKLAAAKAAAEAPAAAEEPAAE